ncbi:MAG: HAD family hydrolase [Chloroflexi bacterium]|nr:HAD family hydrolase [Chloroflexota bacterium]
MPGPIRALLLDLDDTLLLNDADVFAEQYFRALVAKVEHLCPAATFMEAMDTAIHAVWRNDGSQGTNAEVFGDAFFARVDCSPDELMPLLDDFYAHDYNGFQCYTSPDPDARALIELATQRRYQIAIATQPVFPLPAVLARLRWAGVSAETYHYDYIASYDTMRACKPHPHFFESLMALLGRQPDECLMVGDSVEADMPARNLGIKTFWVNRQGLPAPTPCNAHGTLHDLITLIETGEIDAL